jgi:hypothetical protein
MRLALRVILILTFLLAPLAPTAQAQSGVVASLLARMTAEEKVG